jgi:hypothetical protein
MKLTEEVIYLHEDLPFFKEIKPIDKGLRDNNLSPYQLSNFHDTLLNMLGRHPKKQTEINKRIKIIEPKLKKAI